ncbi:DHH family phosphoesterase [Pyrococcus sp. ST04]|uniref:DHH family phosphoesterase n=1 Tax=Pyrococcus sp. ST04 TaxID=1183377 RepID=UPI0002605A85|nr:DHH family phosphoesterase [Pyrococcus sp. ST04]AFK22070.1 putative DHH family protein [Pyrococcus sp. ST04]
MRNKANKPLGCPNNMHLIIHHWDTDGITSSAILVKALKLEDFENVTPQIGEFRFDDRIWRAIEEAERVYVLDLNVPQEAERIPKETLFIDHHVQPRIKNPRVTQINPTLAGKSCPSASFVVSEHFNVWNGWSAIGAVGDLGERAFEIPTVNELLKAEGLSRKDALRLVELIDSNYILVDRRAVEEALHVLLSNELKDLLYYEQWIKNVERIEREVEKALRKVILKGKLAIVRFKSPLNIISKVGRKLVWEFGHDVALVVNEDFHGISQVYLRVSPRALGSVNVPELIEKLISMGLNAGGKNDVLGCVCEKKNLLRVLNLIMSYLEVKRNGV